MEKTDDKHYRFGLLGKNISYSFSRGYFTKKFSELGLANHSYENFDLEDISKVTEIIQNTKNLSGLNVTIPYKQDIIPYLNELEPSAMEIGAVNTIKISRTGLKGYNTDVYGFQKSIEPYLKNHHEKALVLGTGGASKAVAYVLDQLKIDVTFVSRTAKNNGFTYENLDQSIMEGYNIVINCSPLGTYPNVTDKPKIPYRYLNQKHLLFDLIYNPEKTAFLVHGEAQGATIVNGLRMLELQAEKAWEIWNT